MTKIFSNYQEQLNILRDKGLEINNEKLVLLKLKEEGYYNLIGGYSEWFKELDKETNTKKYKKDITFDNILSLYEFDSEIRKIFYNYSIKIENMVKSSLSYIFSESYSHDDTLYLKTKNFSNAPNKKNQIEELINKIKELKNLALTPKSKYYKDFIAHTFNKHQHIPLWCLVRILSFGTISKFYKLMKYDDQKKLATALNIKYEYLSSFLEILVQFRNIVAHGERTFPYKCKNLTLSSNLKIYNQLNIVRNKYNDPIHGRKDVLAIFIIFKYFLSKDEFSNFFNEFKYKLDDLKMKEPSDIYHKILKEMGFNNNKWYELNNIVVEDIL